MQANIITPLDLRVEIIDSLPHKWEFVYAHGQAQDLIDKMTNPVNGERISAPDLVSSNHPLPPYTGVFECYVYDVAPAKLFLWWCLIDSDFNTWMPRGFVILNEDKEGLKYANMKFRDRSRHL